MPRKPKVPKVIWIGLGLYIGAWVVALIAFAVGFAMAMASANQEYPQAAVSDIPPALACLFCMFLVPALVIDIGSVVAATMGHAWGAIVRIVLFVLWVVMTVLSIPTMTMVDACLSLISFAISLGVVICYNVPSAWQYYEACKRYRKGIV